MPQHDVIDNRTVQLSERVIEFLPHCEAAHFAVGYFFLSGFKLIAPYVSGLDKLRLLIGNTTNRETLEQMVEGYHRLEDAQRRQRAILYRAVCDAYGWEYAVLDDEEEILRRLLALNLERAGVGEQ